MRWLTESLAVSLAALPLAAGVLASCAATPSSTLFSSASPAAPAAPLPGPAASADRASGGAKRREMFAGGAAGIAALAGRNPNHVYRSVLSDQNRADQ